MTKTKPEGPARPLTTSEVANLSKRLAVNSEEPPTYSTKKRLRDWALFRMLLDTMLRVSDICALTVGDVHSDTGEIRNEFRIRMIKTSSPVTCMITHKTIPALDAYLRSLGQRGPTASLFGISPRQVQRLVKGWATLISVDATHISPHSLRRTRPTEIYKTTGNLRAVQLMLGHRHITTTAGYIGVELHEALSIFRSLEM